MLSNVMQCDMQVQRGSPQSQAVAGGHRWSQAVERAFLPKTSPFEGST